MFKKGDKVQFNPVQKGGKDIAEFNNKPGRAPLELGQVFVVDSVRKAGTEYEMVFIRDHEGNLRNFYSWRFLPAKAKQLYEVGDKVVIRKDLNDFYDYYVGDGVHIKCPDHAMMDGIGQRWLGLNHNMIAEAGREFEIVQVVHSGDFRNRYYRLKGIDYQWNNWFFETEFMSAPAFEYKVGDKAFVKQKPVDLDVAPKWLDAMDKTIGKSYKIKEVHKEYVILSNNRAYRRESIVPYDEKKHAVKKHITVNMRIKEARDYAKKEIANGRLNGTCSYVKIYHPVDNKDSVMDPQWNDVCHARLTGNGHLAALLDFVGGHEVVKSQPRAFRKWVNYIQKNSPWSVAYKAKDAKNAIISGLELNPEVHGDVIGGACIAMRMGSEYPDMLERFGKMFKFTKNPNVAFLLAFSFNKMDKKTVTLGSMAGGHSVLSGNLTATKLLEFFKNGYSVDKINPKPEQSYAHIQKYTVFKAMTGDVAWGGDRGDKTWDKYVIAHSKANLVGAGGFGGKVYKCSMENFKEFVKILEKEIA